jgi:V/A-type H+-transporting ATPase subunit I
MIVPMQKLHIVARARDRDRLLEALRELGLLHLTPVDPGRAFPDEETTRRLQAVERAAQVLASVAPKGAPPELAADEAAHEVLEIQRRAAEGRNRLAALYHQLEEIAVWGNVTLEDIEQLRQAGVEVRFYAVPLREVDSIQADCAEVMADMPGRDVFVAVASRSGSVVLPEEASEVPLPPRDAPSIRAEAAQIDDALHRDVDRLHELAGLAPQIRKELTKLQEEADYAVAQRGGLADEDLFALQGWLPDEAVSTLSEQLAARDLAAAVEVLQPEPDEQPPTLVRPPAWARPIEGMFKMLGTVPGYREFDVSVPFLIALPIFTAVLISDAGYGALLLVALAAGYPRISKSLGAPFTQLLMLVGAVSIVWGVLVSAFFGFTLYPPLILIDLSDASRDFMMRLSFTVGAIHLSAAQLWNAVRAFPDLRFLNKVGWAVFIWGMYGVVGMFVLKGPFGWGTPWPYALILGATLAILFASPSRNLAKMIGIGLAQFPLSMLSAFSDVISYVRLMAVGLASSVLAVSFNDMALSVDSWLLAAVILVFGHSLNMGLAMIAMFAHGVRLNMLEFSNNLGMQWSGYPYRPFTQRIIQEQTQ